MEEIFRTIEKRADNLRRLEYDYRKWREDILQDNMQRIDLYCNEIVRKLKRLYKLSFPYNMDVKLNVSYDEYGSLLRYYLYIFFYYPKEKEIKEDIEEQDVRIYAFRMTNTDNIDLLLVENYPPKYSDVKEVGNWSLYGDEIRFKMKQIEMYVEDYMLMLDDIMIINYYLKPCTFPLHTMFKYFFVRYCKDKIVETRLSILYILYHYTSSNLSIFPYEIILKICKMAQILE